MNPINIYQHWNNAIFVSLAPHTTHRMQPRLLPYSHLWSPLRKLWSRKYRRVRHSRNCLHSYVAEWLARDQFSEENPFIFPSPDAQYKNVLQSLLRFTKMLAFC